MSDFERYSDAVANAFQRKEAERKELSDKRDKYKILEWFPTEENPAHGVGWFFEEGQFVAYRKWSNGWERSPTAVLDPELVKALAMHLFQNSPTER